MRNIPAILVLFLFPVLLRGQDAAYRYVEKQTYVYDLTVSTVLKTDIGGKLGRTSEDVTAQFEFVLMKRHADGTQECQSRIRSLRARIDGPEGTQEWGDEYANSVWTCMMDAGGHVIKRDARLLSLGETENRIISLMVDFLPPLDPSRLRVDGEWSDRRVDSTGTAKMPIVTERRSETAVKEKTEALGRDCLRIVREADIRTEGVIMKFGEGYQTSSRGDYEGELLYDIANGIAVSLTVDDGSNEDLFNQSDGRHIATFERGSKISYILSKE